MEVKVDLVKEIHDHQGAIRLIEVHPEGKMFFARSDEMVILYELDTGLKLKGFYDSAGYSAARFGAEGRTLIYSSDDQIRFFDLTLWQENLVVPGELREFHDENAHPGARLIARADRGGSIGIFKLNEPDDSEPIFVLKGHTNYIECLTFHPSGKILASGSADKTIRFWSISTRQQISIAQVHDDFVTGLAFSPDGKTLISGDYAGRLKIWKILIIE